MAYEIVGAATTNAPQLMSLSQRMEQAQSALNETNGLLVKALPVQEGEPDKAYAGSILGDADRLVDTANEVCRRAAEVIDLLGKPLRI